MKSNSLIFKTRLIGLLSALLLVAFAVFFTIFAIFFDKRTEIRHIVSLQKEIQAHAMSLPKILKNYKLQLIDAQRAIEVAKNGKHLLNDPLIREIFSLSQMAVYSYEDYYYYSLKIDNQTLWLRSEYKITNYIFYILSASLVLVILLLWLHLYIQSSLKPLNDLHRQIIDYGKSKKLTPLKFKNSNEISTLAYAFYDSVERLNSMQQSRITLIDTFMHEIKSTLTKLILRTHLIEDENAHKSHLLGNMNKMQKQLGQVKEYNSVMMEMLAFDFQDYYLNSILDVVLYELDSALIYNKDLNPILHIDKNLFTTALKALIQDATQIKVTHNILHISTTIKENSKTDLDHSIAESILAKHEFNLQTSHSSALRTFEITF